MLSRELRGLAAPPRKRLGKVEPGLLLSLRRQDTQE